MPITTILIIIGLIIAVILALLIWQARVRPYTYDELFVLPDEEDIPMESPEGEPRIITLGGATNLRDIGGYQAKNGSRVRWREVLRSARLYDLTDEGCATLQELGVRTVVDLRQSKNVGKFPNRMPEDITYEHIPVFEDVPMSPRKVVFNRHRLLNVFTDVYIDHIIERGGPTFGRIIRLIADPANRPLLYHCTAGKDRTGILTMLILRTLGVPEETVVNDYLLTNKSSGTFIEQVDAQLGAVKGVSVEQLYPLLAASPKLIYASLGHIRSKYGDVESYLTQKAELDHATLTQLREQLLTTVEEPLYVQ